MVCPKVEAPALATCKVRHHHLWVSDRFVVNHFQHLDAVTLFGTLYPELFGAAMSRLPNTNASINHAKDLSPTSWTKKVPSNTACIPVASGASIP